MSNAQKLPIGNKEESQGNNMEDFSKESDTTLIDENHIELNDLKAKEKEKDNNSYSLDIQQLVNIGGYIGHSISETHPLMKKHGYVVEDADGTTNRSLLNLDKTVENLKEACLFLERLVAKYGNNCLFVCNKRNEHIILTLAQSVGSSSVTHKWLNGLLTNFNTCKYYLSKYKHRPKSDILDKTDKRVKRFYNNFNLYDLPNVIILIGYNPAVVKEATITGVPVIAFIDSNGNPSGIKYVLPCNDDSQTVLNFVLAPIVEAIKNGMQLRIASGKGGRFNSNKTESDKRKDYKVGRNYEKNENNNKTNNTEVKPKAKTEHKNYSDLFKK